MKLTGGAIDGSSTTVGSPSPQAVEQARWRGWFYRAVATDPQAAVLEFGAPYVRHWFPDVVTGDPAGLSFAAPGPTFGTVILHATLAGCPTLTEAFRAAHRALEPRGVAVVAGYNRWRHRQCVMDAPCASPSEFRHAARDAGFTDVSLYLARPDLDYPDCMIAADRRSAQAYFRFELAVRRSRGRLRHPFVRSFAAMLDIPRWVEPCIIVIARKC